MTRIECETVAYKIAKTLLGLQDTLPAQGGVVLAALMISDEVTASGRMDSSTFLSLCGISGQTFRNKKVIAPEEAMLVFENARLAEETERSAKGKKPSKLYVAAE